MEKRQHLRISIEPMEIVIEEIGCNKGKIVNVTLFIDDVSQEGIRFISDEDFSTDEIVSFHLPSLNIETLITGRIAWKVEAAANRFQYGLQIFK